MKISWQDQAKFAKAALEISDEHPDDLKLNRNLLVMAELALECAWTDENDFENDVASSLTEYLGVRAEMLEGNMADAEWAAHDRAALDAAIKDYEEEAE